MYNTLILLFLSLFFYSCGSTPKLTEDESWDIQADELRKSKMSEEELAWENALEKNLGEADLISYKNRKLGNKESNFDFLEEDPRLPRVLLIGDAQSSAYTLILRAKLKGTANVIRIPENGVSSSYAVANIERWLNTTTKNKKWDLIHFQFGLGDKKTPLYNYAQNIRQLVRVLKRTKAKLLWSNTTPTIPRETSIALNQISERTMKAHNIPIADVYSAELPYVNDDQKYGEALGVDGIETIASTIASAIKKELAR